MAEQNHEQWLAKKQQHSIEQQKTFMGNIAGRLGHSRMTKAPERPFVGSPSFWQEKVWDQETCIETFTQHFISVGGHVQRVSSREQASQFISAKAQELSATRILMQNEPALHALALETSVQSTTRIQYWNTDDSLNWKQVAAQADIGIVEAEHAVAYTGTVVVTSSEQKGRSVSLLPTVLVVLIPASRFVTRLGEVLSKVKGVERRQLPAGIHFITGPSRSSDIENDLTIGVHGPGVVFAIIIDNE